MPALRFLLWSADGLFALLLCADFLRAGDPARVRVTRRVPARARLGQEFERVLVVEGGRPGLRATLFEGAPASFHAPEGPAESACFDGTGRATSARRYRPERRGRQALSDVRLRVRGPLGLVERQVRFTTEQPVAVEPALLQLSKTLRLAASERWQDLGVRLLRQRGGLSEFESLREYVPGDELRHVDWKAFARRGQPMVRSYQVERGQELLLLLDVGRRMRTRGSLGAHAGWTKLDFALDAALELAAVALQEGDRVGCAAFERRLFAYVPPRKGARCQARLSEALFALEPSEQEGDLARALRELAVRHRRRATVVVLSDVADPLSLAAQHAALAAGARHHRLVFAALDDPELRAAAAEESDVALRAAALALQAERSRSLRILASAGVRVLDALPAEAAGPLLTAWLAERRTG